MNMQTERHFASEVESMRGLLGRLVNHSTTLAKDEIELIKQELREQMQILRSGVIAIAAGSILCFLALMSFCAALIIALTFYLTWTIAALVVGIGLGIVGSIIIFFGARFIRKMNMKPGEFVH